MAAPIASIDTNHTDMIHDAQLDYYGTRLATCSSDRLIKIYDVVEGTPQECTAEIRGHEGPVWAVSWAHPKYGVLLASCSYDHRVIVHKETSPGVWSPVYTNAKHEGSVNDIAWGPHEGGLAIASASSDGHVIVSQHAGTAWAETKFEVARLGVNAVDWAPHGHLGSQRDGAGPVRRLVAACCDGTARVYVEGAEAAGAPAWKLEQTLSGGHDDWVRTVAWAPTAGLPVNTIATGGQDGSVLVWTQDHASGEFRNTKIAQYAGPVWRVSWSLTGSVLAVAHGEQEVALWKQALDGSWNEIAGLGEEEASAM